MTIDSPVLPWRSDMPPASTKVVYLTRYGVLNIGDVTRHEWDCGFVVCWQHCPRRPSDWDALLARAVERIAQK